MAHQASVVVSVELRADLKDEAERNSRPMV
jgi:hypothetical protein